LFYFQRLGTGRVGALFGPLMIVWFLTLGVLGLTGLRHAPEILGAVNPVHGARFLALNGWSAFATLGSVFLAVTGAEALYADMGHFGAKPIRRSWFALVFPALVLNYFGQGALLLKNPAAAENPFYLLAPTWALYPLVALATSAAVIASQALISGSFSLTMHAVQLGYLPRLEIRHTSSAARGQIYMPQVNFALMLACLGLVLGFRSSSNLAAAYGIAVTLTMLTTTFLLYFAARSLWQWTVPQALGLCGALAVIEGSFCGANLLKIAQGGWFPLVVGGFVYMVMSTWRTGRQILRNRLQSGILPVTAFLESLELQPPLKVKGTAIYMAGNAAGTPTALLHNLKHNKVLHETTILLTILTEEIPHSEDVNRVHVETLGPGFHRVTARYGFMDEPDVSLILRHCEAHEIRCAPMETTFFLGRESIIPTERPGMALWRERLFAFLSRNAQPATAFFRLPANRVVELGMQVEL
jgi:KUP system potassium uptake protein